MWFMALPKDMLFVELAKDLDDWLLRSGMIVNRSGLELDCFDRLVVGNVKDKMKSIARDGESIAWYSWLLWVMFVAKASSIPGPFFSWTRGIWGNM
jgi:hypothetical protein